AIVGLIDAGAPQIRITNRTRSSAEALAAEFGNRLSVVDWSERDMATAGVGLMVNTTSLGMVWQPPLDIRLDDLPREAVVNDIVYVPLETGLLRAARQRGNRVVDGLGMLLHQARPAFRAWWGILPEVTPGLRQRIEETL
ncbi:MAG TPA: shikimate dehydrogenase, partial [Beijerinckiaceae bacterium]|nr:shikimate dehydrogenase [Beijerinckiaceae bacterium]